MKNRFFCIVSGLILVVFVSGADSINYPLANSICKPPNRAQTGTGNAPANSAVKYKVWMQGGTLNGEITGTANGFGGWYLSITTNLAQGDNQKAELTDGADNILATNTNIDLTY